MTDARPLLSQIARLTKERDDYADLCRDFSGAESPEALIAALRDRGRMEAEIARLKAELAAAEQATQRLKAERDDLQSTFDRIWAADMRAIDRWAAEKPQERALTMPDHVDLVMWLGEQLIVAETATRTALEAIPIAMTAAAEKEREACAKIADAYAEENLRLADDTIRHDRFITGEERTPETLAKSEVLAIEGCAHSAMFHASQNIAAAIRARGTEGGE